MNKFFSSRVWILHSLCADEQIGNRSDKILFESWAYKFSATLSKLLSRYQREHFGGETFWEQYGNFYVFERELSDIEQIICCSPDKTESYVLAGAFEEKSMMVNFFC